MVWDRVRRKKPKGRPVYKEAPVFKQRTGLDSPSELHQAMANANKALMILRVERKRLAGQGASSTGQQMAGPDLKAMDEVARHIVTQKGAGENLPPKPRPTVTAAVPRRRCARSQGR